MNVIRGVRMAMMPAVLGCPPQDAPLRRRLRQEGQEELKGSTGAEGAVGEIAMIAGTDRENAQPIKCHSQRHGTPCHASPDGANTPEMNQQETEAGGIRDIVVMSWRARAHGAVPRSCQSGSRPNPGCRTSWPPSARRAILRPCPGAARLHGRWQTPDD